MEENSARVLRVDTKGLVSVGCLSDCDRSCFACQSLCRRRRRRQHAVSWVCACVWCVSLRKAGRRQARRIGSARPGPRHGSKGVGQLPPVAGGRQGFLNFWKGLLPAGLGLRHASTRLLLRARISRLGRQSCQHRRSDRATRLLECRLMESTIFRSSIFDQPLPFWAKNSSRATCARTNTLGGGEAKAMQADHEAGVVHEPGLGFFSDQAAMRVSSGTQHTHSPRTGAVTGVPVKQAACRVQHCKTPREGRASRLCLGVNSSWSVGGL